MHADDDVAPRSHVEAIRVIEAVTRDMQVPIPAMRFQAFETKQTVIRAGDQHGNLGGSLFDLAAMRREDNDAGAGTLHPSDAKISSLRLVLRQFADTSYGSLGGRRPSPGGARETSTRARRVKRSRYRK